MKRALNERQKLFLEVLFTDEKDGGASGDMKKAKRLAGYSDTTSVQAVVQSIKEEIEQATRDFFLQVSPKAAMKISGIMDVPTTLGAKELLAASKELLDRAGIVKVDKVDISAPSGGLFILPEKKKEEDGED